MAEMSSSQLALKPPTIGISSNSTPSVAIATAEAAAASKTASKLSPTIPMGNSISSNSKSCTNGLSLPKTHPQSNHVGLPAPKHPAPYPMANGAHKAAITGTPSTTITKMSEFEIIDLCSDSDGEDTKMPPKKKAKLDDDISKSSSDYGVEEISLAEGIGRGMDADTREEVMCGVTWKRSDDILEGDQEGKDKWDDNTPSTALVQMTQESKRGDHPKNNTFTKAAPATSNNEIVIKSENLGFFECATSPVSKSADATNCVIPRIEIMHTKSGIKTRKMFGPFVFEDDSEDGGASDDCGDVTMRSPRDEGYHSFSSGAVKPASSKGRNIPGSGSGSEHSLPDIMDKSAKQTKVDDMELFQRRRQSEDKCAETSRRMREEALQKREAEMQEAQKAGLSEGFLEDSSGVKSNAKSYRSDMQIGEDTNPTSPRTCFANNRRSKQGKFDNDDELFGDDTLSAESIEAQLDLVQAFANNNGNFPSPKEVNRSYQPSTPASSTEKADSTADLDSSPSDDQDPLLQGSILHRERQLLNGGVGKTAISGSEHYSQEQAENYWRKVNKEEKRKKEEWPVTMEVKKIQEEIGPSPRAGAKVIGGALGKDEAGLLAVKESPRTAKQPLRAAPNVSGVLAQLAKNARGTVAEPAGPEEFYQGPRNAQHPSPTAHARQCTDLTIDDEVWTKDGTPRERKRDVENLMGSFTEIARCWCLVYDTLSRRFQSNMKSQVRELKAFADPILRGCTLRKNAGRRINDIKKNVERRLGKERVAGRLVRNISRHEIESKLVDLMGRERFHQGLRLLDKVREEWEDHKVNRKHTTHRKRLDSQPDNNASARSKPMLASNMSRAGMDSSRTGSDDSDPYEGFDLNSKQRVAWQREDKRRERMKEALARYEKLTEPDGRIEKSKSVRFADRCLWDNEYDHAQSSEFEESDEDEVETAPPFGRGEDRSSNTAPGIEMKMGNAEIDRRSVGAKGLFSRSENGIEKAMMSTEVPPNRSTARKSLPAPNGNMQPTEEQRISKPATRREVGGKSVLMINQYEPQEDLITNVDHSNVEGSQQEVHDLQYEREGSWTDDGDMTDVHNDVYGTQYDIVADYEDFDDYEDAHSVSLGRHIDPRAAHRQMTRVMLDTVETALRKFRGTGRIIWDIENCQVIAHSVILPTGGECRIRKMKSWVSAADWPGKHRVRAVPVPQVYYIVHETKKTSLRPPSANEEETADDEPADFEDPQALIEKEQPMGFPNRESANSSAFKRMIAFDKRHSGAEGAEDTEDAQTTVDRTDLVVYMEQIEHDRLCFEQDKRVWIETKDGRQGKEEIKIWVEEMLVDMHHV